MSVGSIVGNIGKLFMTAEDLEKKRKERKRRLERGVENAIDTLREGKTQASAARDRFYQQGKEKLAVGRDLEARQFFEFSRMQGRQAANYTRQELMWSNALTQLQVAGAMQGAAVYFKQMASELGLDPSVFDNGLEAMEDIEGTIGEMNRAMSRKWDRDSAKAGASEEAGDASIDEMMNQARNEVAAENGLTAPGAAAAAPTSRV